MKSLLIIAHGSRREESNKEVAALRDKIAAQSPEIPLIQHAFLELATPGILEGASKLVLAGAREILVLPYFLVAGQHVVADIPEEVTKITDQYPDIQVTVAPYFGSSEGVVLEVLSQVHQSI